MLRSGWVTPAGAVIRGLAAGAVGTAAMDLVQYAEERLGGGQTPFRDWEFGGVDGWDGAPAPAQVGKRLVEGLFQTRLPDDRANLVNNVMHWGYGIAWGAAFGILAGSARSPRSRWGPPFGATVWLSGYAVLPATGLYEPLWKYDVGTLAKDLAHHLVYGTATASAFSAPCSR